MEEGSKAIFFDEHGDEAHCEFVSLNKKTQPRKS